MSGMPRRAADTAKPLMKPSSKPGLLDQPGRHRVVAAGHHQDAGPLEQDTQTFRWTHRGDSQPLKP